MSEGDPNIDASVASTTPDAGSAVPAEPASDAGLVEFEGKKIDFMDLPDDKVSEFLFTLENKNIQESNENNNQNSNPEVKDETLIEITPEMKVEFGFNENANKNEESPTQTNTQTETEKKTEETPKEEQEQKTEVDPVKREEINLKALEDLEMIYSPFKADGREMTVDKPEEVIKLMQMGVNYNRRMMELKPAMKFAKMLENNGLMNEDKLSQVIDIYKGKPDAIGKFLKDNKIDVEQLSGEDVGKDYKPGDYKVNDQEIELDSVLNSIKGNPSYSKTINIITNELDDTSKKQIVNNPNFITQLDGHVQSGVFDKVMAEVNKQKILGNIAGIPDIQAYTAIGQKMLADGKLTEQKPTTELIPSNGQAETKKEEPKKVDETVVNQKRQTLSPTQAATSSNMVSINDIDPSSISDEDFQKIAKNLPFFR